MKSGMNMVPDISFWQYLMLKPEEKQLTMRRLCEQIENDRHYPMIRWTGTPIPRAYSQVIAVPPCPS